MSKEKRIKLRMKYEEKLSAKGLRFVRFVVPLDLWDHFIAEKCQRVKPNDLFIEWLREQGGAEG